MTRPSPARRSTVSRWISNSDFAGAYSFLRPGGSPADRDALGRAVAPGLILAGEYTWRDSPGTLHGAIFSGERAARIALADGAVRVVVIGAGLAGIAAARALRDAGVDVIVLEAGECIGGRAASDTTLGGALPLGGAWLHGNVGHPLAAHVSTRPWNWDDSVTIVRGHGALDPARAARVDAQLAEIEDAVSALAATRDVSLADALNAVIDQYQAPDALDALMLDAWLRLHYDNLVSAPKAELSARHRSEPYHLPGGDHQIVGGLSEAIARLADGLDIRLRQRVRALQREFARWHIETAIESDIESDIESGEPLDASHVICATPAPILRDGRIAITPALPSDVRASLDRIGSGRVAKAFFTFDEAFWLPSRRFVITDAPVPMFELFVDVSPLAGQPTLCAFAVGEHALAAEQLSETDRCRAVDAILAAWSEIRNSSVLMRNS
jgi:monoamine oxidase